MDDLSQHEKMNLVVAIGNWKEGEDAKYWTRYSIFLTMNSGILAASFIGDISILDFKTTTHSIPVGGVFIGLFGILLSYTWLKLLMISKSYISRWISDLDCVLASDETLYNYIKGYSDASSRVQTLSNTNKATDYAKKMVFGYIAIWFAVLAFRFIELCSFIIAT